MLIGDRFLCRDRAELEGATIAAIDLATGAHVYVRGAGAGTRAEQQTWAERCARAMAEGTLVDFDFIGTALRFEAHARDQQPQPERCAQSTSVSVEWLEHPRGSSPRVLHVGELPEARPVRQLGFVQCDLRFLDGASDDVVREVAAGRSVILLDRTDEPARLALTVLRLRQFAARDLCMLVRRSDSQSGRAVHAAEGRAAYGHGPRLAEPRAGQVIVEIERLSARGRHAAAERALRAAIAACDRRGDSGRSGVLGLRLGQLLLARGRAEEARVLFDGAHARFQQLRLPERGIEAMACMGLAQTDLSRLSEAEQSCRAAYAAAAALGGAEVTLFPAIALARVLSWQKRSADARSVLEAITPSGDGGLCARYWCLVARLYVAAGAIGDAWKAVERARPPAATFDAATESVVRECEASIQARLGDIEALRCHVEHGLSAARAAHLPLQAIKLRLTYVEGLSRARRQGPARAAARHLANIRATVVPPLLKARIESVIAGLSKPSAVHESPARFQPASLTSDLQDLDGLRDLLAGSHRLEDETDALSRAATAIRRHVQAAGVGIFGWHDSTPRLCASSGTSSSTMAQRSIDIGQPILPERSGSGLDGAVPIQYLGRVIGAMALRWSIEGPENTERALAFSAAACAVCAPLVYVLIERESAPVGQDAPFDLVGVSPAIEEMRKAIARAANAPFTVLLEGESGSGKELVARAIHRAGCRRDRRFSALNCAAMPEDLVDAELFGHAKGAFTGAAVERLGLFESADGGTVFLDEVGELSSRAQAKVLRVLQEGEIRRIGENFTRPFDARLIAATNRSLRAEAEAGRFRQDLLYRLDVIRINVPPLRERVEDIPLLAGRFWRQSAERMGSKAVLGQSAVSALARYDWPGNVRELQNVLMALVVAVPLRGVVSASELPAAIARAAQLTAHESLESARLKFEKRFVRAALARAAGHRGRAAAALGLSRQGLAKLMQRLKLDA